MDQNQLDKLFKDKLANSSTAFDTEAWNTMESLIAAEEKKVVWYNGKLFWTILILLVFTSGISLWTFNQNELPTIASVKQPIPIKQSIEKNKEHQISSAFTSKNDQASTSSLSQKDYSTTTVKKSRPIESDATRKTEVNQSPPIEISVNEIKPKASINDMIAVATTRKKNQPIQTRKTTSGSFEMNMNIADLERVFIPFNELNLLTTGLIKPEEKYSAPVELPMNNRGLSILRNIDLKLIVGGGIAWGHRNPSDDSPTRIGYSPTAGLSIGYIVNSEFSFDINTLYHMRTGLSPEPSLHRNSSITHKMLHYLDVPFYLNYHTGRHSFQLGMQYSYLVAEYQETKNHLDQNAVTSWRKTGQYKNGDLAGVLGYNFMLNEGVTIGTRLNYGLFDSTGDQLAIYETIDKNLHLNLLLEYKLSKY